MIITIDGPAGAGKSSVAERLAGRLGFERLDTGALYRAVTLAALRSGIDAASADALADLVAGLEIAQRHGRTFLGDEDISTDIRSEEVTRRVRDYAGKAVVRDQLSDLQRRVAGGGNFVTDGRDQGTVVFPQARHKFFLTASAEERARRRQRDEQARGRDVPLAVILAEIQDRDDSDSSRALAPLRPAEDALRIDTTGISLDQVVDQLERHVRGG